MSEIYLTKIERKTIFTRSLIFVLIMFIISDLTVTGPFYFNFIPWMYILGTLGSVKKIDGILMCVIGTFTVFVASLIMQGGFTLPTVISTVITLGTLILGIITGKIIYEFILEHRLVKYIQPKKKAIYIALIVLMVVASFVSVGLNSGNVISYLKSRNSLKEYVSKTYGIDSLDDVTTKYNRQVVGDYVYVVSIDGQEVYFVPVANGIFKDANLEERLEVLNSNLQKEMEETIQNTLNKYLLLQDAEVIYSLEYTKLGVSPDMATVSIKCVSDEENLQQLYVEITECIAELQTVKQTQKVVINVNDKSLEISETHISEITPEYIKGGFNIEETVE